MIIPVPPVSITLSTASEYLNLSSSAVLNRLQLQNRNYVDAYLPPQPRPPLPKSDTIVAAILCPL